MTYCRRKYTQIQKSYLSVVLRRRSTLPTNPKSYSTV